jgi:hypothetical protein
MSSKVNVVSVWAVVVIGVLGMAESARADVVFSNLGPDDSWDHGNAYVLRGPFGSGSSPSGGKAMPFTPDFTAVFTSVELPLGVMLIPGTNYFIVELRADNDGLPGDVIESFAFEDVPYVFSPDQTLSVGISELNPVLEEGTTYWLAAFPGELDTSGGWNWTSPLQTGTWAASSDDGATWELNPFGRPEISAFRINGDPTGPG